MTLVRAALVLAAAVLGGSFTDPLGVEAAGDDDTVNDVFGDASYVEAFGAPPDDGVDDAIRVRTHLARVEELLRSRDVSHWPRELRLARAKNLDRLHDYWIAGAFPENPEGGRRAPRFVDDDESPALAEEPPPRLCAVGHLLAQDLGDDAAREVDASFCYARIGEIDSPALAAWADASGLTSDELALIQPKYRPRPPPVDASGRPTPDAVRRALSTRLREVDGCVHAARGPREEHPRTIAAEATVGPGGDIVRLTLSTGLDPEDLSIQRCVARSLGTLFFASFRGEPVVARHAFSITTPTRADGTLNAAYMPVVFRRGESTVRACTASVDPFADHGDVLVEATVDPDGTWRSVTVSGPNGTSRAVRSCVRRTVLSLELPAFEGAARRITHVYAL